MKGIRRCASLLVRIAPLNNAESITNRISIVAGGNDPRVPVNEAQQMVRTMRANKTPVWYLMAKDEGHGFAKKEEPGFSVLRDGDVYARAPA